MSVSDPQFTGEVFFSSSLDTKLKAWKIDNGTLTLLHCLDSPNGSPVNSLSNSGGEMVFGGCEDGSIIAWNVLANDSDCMQPTGMNKIVKLQVYNTNLIVARDDKQIDVYDMNNQFL